MAEACVARGRREGEEGKGRRKKRPSWEERRKGEQKGRKRIEGVKRRKKEKER